MSNKISFKPPHIFSRDLWMWSDQNLALRSLFQAVVEVYQVVRMSALISSARAVLRTRNCIHEWMNECMNEWREGRRRTRRETKFTAWQGREKGGGECYLKKRETERGETKFTNWVNENWNRTVLKRPRDTQWQSRYIRQRIRNGKYTLPTKRRFVRVCIQICLWASLRQN